MGSELPSGNYITQADIVQRHERQAFSYPTGRDRQAPLYQVRRSLRIFRSPSKVSTGLKRVVVKMTNSIKGGLVKMKAKTSITRMAHTNGTRPRRSTPETVVTEVADHQEPCQQSQSSETYRMDSPLRP